MKVAPLLVHSVQATLALGLLGCLGAVQPEPAPASTPATVGASEPALVDAGSPPVSEGGYDASFPPLPPADAGPGAVADAGPGPDPQTPVQTAGQGCVPWPQADHSPFVPSPSDPLAQPSDTVLASTAEKLAGTWIGHAVAPAAWLPQTWDVLLTFAADGAYAGHYSARATAGAPSFYYGSDDPLCSPLRKWQLFGVSAEGVFGAIDVAFFYPPSQCDLPVWQGGLSQLATDASGTRLHLAFARSDGYGPVTYDFWKVCAAK
jgi:hypothetical protein